MLSRKSFLIISSAFALSAIGFMVGLAQQAHLLTLIALAGTIITGIAHALLHGSCPYCGAKGYRFGVNLNPFHKSCGYCNSCGKQITWN